MNNNQLIHDYFGLTPEAPKLPPQVDYVIEFAQTAQGPIAPYDLRLAQLEVEYEVLNTQFKELRNAPTRGIFKSFSAAWKEMNLESKMKKNRELSVIVAEERYRVYHNNYIDYKLEGQRLYGNQFEDGK